MRVIAGTAKSLRLVAPKGAEVRPTSDAIRETLFNILGGSIVNQTFLDVYAGSGAVGIEALSRGASSCVFVERDKRCMQAIARNLENTRLTERARVVRGDARRIMSRVVREYGPFGVIFVDPPYADHSAPSVVNQLLGPQALRADGVLILQHSSRMLLGDLPEPESVRQFGETVLSFFSPLAKER